MVMRITNNMKTQNAKNNIFRITEMVNNAQERLITGKKVNRPSDDPIGMRQIMTLRTDGAKQGQFIRNSEYSANFLSHADSVVDSLQKLAGEARSLAIQQANYLPNQQQRVSSANQVDLWISEAFSLANSTFGSRHVFGGQNSATDPLQNSASGAIYVGDNQEITVEVNDGNNVGINLVGSDVFAADLNADIDSNTLISNFHRGSGVSAGQVSITNRLGATANVTIGAGYTVGQVISAVNSSGLNVTASINSTGDGISITDSNANPTGNLLIQDVGTGTTARELGIIGNAVQSIDGIKAQTGVTGSTALTLLNGGSGITLSDVSVLNGAASGTISFTGATTVQDVLDTFNNAGLNLNATLNSAGNGLQISSATGSTVPVVLDIGTGSTASDLGLGGAKNFFAVMTSLKTALENNDARAASGLVESLGAVSGHLSSIRGIVGSRVNMVESNVDALTITKENAAELVALTENDDFAASATDLAAYETALNASLATTARIIQPSLVDFLR